MATNMQVKRLIRAKDTVNYDSIYKLRYQVYCKEADFLDPDDFKDGRECDRFDNHSEHFLATTDINSPGSALGTVRLVKWTGKHSFPTASYYHPLLNELETREFPLDSTAEISRLCISKKYLLRAVNRLYSIARHTEEDHDWRRKYPLIIIELFKAMYQSSKHDLGITHWIATFEDCLYRLLSRYGVQLDLLSPDEIDYYGKVKVYGASIAQIEKCMAEKRPELFAYITA